MFCFKCGHKIGYQESNSEWWDASNHESDCYLLTILPPMSDSEESRIHRLNWLALESALAVGFWGDFGLGAGTPDSDTLLSFYMDLHRLGVEILISNN